jgi:putative flippase GtrA
MGEVIRYAIGGVANTSLSLTLIWAGIRMGFAPVTANFVGYSAGICLSFFLNRWFVFRPPGPRSLASHGHGLSGQAIRYALSVAAAYGLNLVTLTAGIARGLPVMGSQILASIVYSGLLFLLCRWVVYRSVPPGRDGNPTSP